MPLFIFPKLGGRSDMNDSKDIKGTKDNIKENNKYKSDVFTVPNFLSLFRFALVPLFMWLYLEKKEYTLTAAILLLSGITDIADGFIARRFNMISDLGKALDPVADKMTQAAMLFCLMTSFPHMAIPLILLAIKEIFTCISKIAAIKKTGEVSGARWHGKVTTFLLYSMLLVHVVKHDISPVVSDVLIGVCTASMLFSFAMYSFSNIKAVISKK